MVRLLFCLWALVCFGCASAPAPKPVPQSATSAPQPQGRVVKAQAVVPVEPIAVPDSVAVPIPGALPGPVPFVIVPDGARELSDLDRGSTPGPGTARPDAEPKPSGPPEPEKAGKKPKGEDPKSNRKPGPAQESAPRIQKKAWDPAPDVVPDNWNYPPGKRPCNIKGSGGRGLSRGGPVDRVKCEYDCGGKGEVRYFYGNSRDVCLDPFRRPVY